ncbi:MAG: LysE family transporter [Chitinophagaceae bacterium]
MFSLLTIFFTGMLISFLGSLPLGSLNVSAMQIAITENIKKAVYFSLGVALVEILYVRLSLTGIDWVIAHQQLFYILEWITVFLFVILGISSFWAAGKKNTATKNILLNNTMNRFWLGFTMSAINPVQIPFWFIWSAYLFSNKILLPVPSYFNVYIAGIGTGTLTGLAIFIFAGRWLLVKLQASQRIINIIVGIVFIISAAIQLYRVLYKPLDKQLKIKVARVIFSCPANRATTIQLQEQKTLLYSV